MEGGWRATGNGWPTASSRSAWWSRSVTANGGSSLVADRARAVAAADAALRLVAAHDPGAGRRIGPAYVVWSRISSRAFEQAASHGGRVPRALSRELERRLGRLEA